MLALRQLLEEMVKIRASDLHITAGLPAQYRIDGQIVPSQSEKLPPELTKQVLYSILNVETPCL